MSLSKFYKMIDWDISKKNLNQVIYAKQTDIGRGFIVRVKNQDTPLFGQWL